MTTVTNSGDAASQIWDSDIRIFHERFSDHIFSDMGLIFQCKPRLNLGMSRFMTPFITAENSAVNITEGHTGKQGINRKSALILTVIFSTYLWSFRPWNKCSQSDFQKVNLDNSTSDFTKTAHRAFFIFIFLRIHTEYGDNKKSTQPKLHTLYKKVCMYGMSKKDLTILIFCTVYRG